MTTERLNIAPLAAQVAAELGGTLTTSNPEYDHYAVISTATAPLSFHYDSYRKRLNVSDTFLEFVNANGEKERFHIKDALNYNDRGNTVLSINVNPARGAAAIAKDIKRRLMPTLEPTWAKAVEYVAKRTADEADKRSLAEVFKQKFGYEGGNGRNGSSATTLRGYRVNLPSIDVQYAGSVRFEAFSVDAGTATKLLEAIKAHAVTEVT